MAQKLIHRSQYPKMLPAEGRPLNYCGIRCCIEVLGGKWKMLLISLLAERSMRYSELRRAIPEVSEKMLISSLQELEYHGIVHRQVLEAVPPQVAYSLTDYGRTVTDVATVLYEWGERHIATHGDKIFFPAKH
jgi:DNA-binding HxlR family transcriptional regulator